MTPAVRALLDGEKEARLIALACSHAPDGYRRWTLRLLAKQLIKLEIVDSISHETVRQSLKKNKIKPWRKTCWCIPPKGDAVFVAAMEDILDVYQRPEDPRFPVVCLDEFSKQLLGESRQPIPGASGRPERYDSEYIRKGSATAFLIYAPFVGTREILISEGGRRTAQDYAHVIEHLVEEMFPEAEKIILVEDNLNTHRDASLYQTFTPEKAHNLARKIERHHTPKHGSWLNIAESEIAAITKTTLPDRVGSLEEFRRLCELGKERRNQAKLITQWRFTTKDARIKLARLYPSN